MHTVPQIMGSLRLLPAAVSLTQCSNFDAFAVFPNNGSTIRRLVSLHAVRVVPFPPFPGTIKALRLAAVLCAALGFLRLALPLAALNSVETTASPKFLGNLHYAYARFFDSGVTARSSP
jgi:hypothetical protein